MREVRSAERVFYHGQWCTRVRYDSGATGLYAEGCTYCDREMAEHEPYFPSHWASSGCRSGKHSHCTCDACW